MTNGLDPYTNLAGAILKTAVEDYLEAVERKQKRRIKCLEKFFLSEYGQILALGMGETILRKAQEIAGGIEK